jgi:hypothetical protein
VGGGRPVRPPRGLRQLRGPHAFLRPKLAALCICRAFCPTVVITNTNAGSNGPEQQPQGSGAGFPAPPLSAGGAGQVGKYLSAWLPTSITQSSTRRRG